MLRPCSVRGRMLEVDPGRIELVPGPNKGRPAFGGRMRWVCSGCVGWHALPVSSLEWSTAVDLGATVVEVMSRPAWLDKAWWWPL